MIGAEASTMRARALKDSAKKALVFDSFLATLTLALPAAKPAEAAFAGTKGKIVFAGDRVTSKNPEGDPEIFATNPDGAGLSQLTSNASEDSEPAWSADGGKTSLPHQPRRKP